MGFFVKKFYLGLASAQNFCKMRVRLKVKYFSSASKSNLPYYAGPICLEQIGTAGGWPEGQNKWTYFVIAQELSNDLKKSYEVQAILCGNSSVVEHNLAKVGVASSNLVSRSKFQIVVKVK